MINFSQIMSEIPKLPADFIQHLDDELHTIMTDSNVDFLMAHCKSIPAVIARSYVKVRDLTPSQLYRLYGELVFELALCEDQVGQYRDQQIAAICINLRLQRKLDRVLAPKKPKTAPPTKLECVSTKPRKPKFKPARCVA